MIDSFRPANHEQALGNTLSRRIMDGEDLRKLVDTFGVDQQMTYWDVSIPMVDRRPVIDRSRIIPGEVQKARGNLGIETNPDKTQLAIRITNPHKSRYDATPVGIGLPLIGHAEGSVFSPVESPEEFAGLQFELDKSGRISFGVVANTGDVSSVYEGGNPQDVDYGHMINFARRMLIIPFHEGARRPIVPGVDLAKVSH